MVKGVRVEVLPLIQCTLQKLTNSQKMYSFSVNFNPTASSVRECGFQLGMVSVWSIAGVDQEFSQEVMCWLYTQRSMGFSRKKTLVVGVWVQTFNL